MSASPLVSSATSVPPPSSSNATKHPSPEIAGANESSPAPNREPGRSLTRLVVSSRRSWMKMSTTLLVSPGIRSSPARRRRRSGRRTRSTAGSRWRALGAVARDADALGHVAVAVVDEDVAAVVAVAGDEVDAFDWNATIAPSPEIAGSSESPFGCAPPRPSAHALGAACAGARTKTSHGRGRRLPGPGCGLGGKATKRPSLESARLVGEAVRPPRRRSPRSAADRAARASEDVAEAVVVVGDQLLPCRLEDDRVPSRRDRAEAAHVVAVAGRAVSRAIAPPPRRRKMSPSAGAEFRRERLERDRAAVRGDGRTRRAGATPGTSLTRSVCRRAPAREDVEPAVAVAADERARARLERDDVAVVRDRRRCGVAVTLSAARGDAHTLDVPRRRRGDGGAEHCASRPR